MRRPLTEREVWFRNRIGEKVYRNETCSCFACQQVQKKGLEVEDLQHALYLAEIESAYSADGDHLRYFDTKEEADEFQKSIQCHQKK